MVQMRMWLELGLVRPHACSRSRRRSIEADVKDDGCYSVPETAELLGWRPAKIRALAYADGWPYQKCRGNVRIPRAFVDDLLALQAAEAALAPAGEAVRVVEVDESAYLQLAVRMLGYATIEDFPPFLSIPEAAKMLRRCERTVGRNIEAGRLPSTNIVGGALAVPAIFIIRELIKEAA